MYVWYTMWYTYVHIIYHTYTICVCLINDVLYIVTLLIVTCYSPTPTPIPARPGSLNHWPVWTS